MVQMRKTRADKTINVTRETHQRIIELGKANETVGDVIIRLLDFYEKHH